MYRFARPSWGSGSSSSSDIAVSVNALLYFASVYTEPSRLRSRCSSFCECFVSCTTQVLIILLTDCTRAFFCDRFSPPFHVVLLHHPRVALHLRPHRPPHPKLVREHGQQLPVLPRHSLQHVPHALLNPVRQIAIQNLTKTFRSCQMQGGLVVFDVLYNIQVRSLISLVLEYMLTVQARKLRAGVIMRPCSVLMIEAGWL